MGRKKTGPGGKGDGDDVNLASTCERRDGEARRPGSGEKRMEGERKAEGHGREAASASGPFPRPQRKTEMRGLPSKNEAD